MQLPKAFDAPSLIPLRDQKLMSNALRKAIANNLDLNWYFLPIASTPTSHSSQSNPQALDMLLEPFGDDSSCWWSPEKVQHHLAMMDSLHFEHIQSLARQKTISYRTLYRRRRHRLQRAEVRKDNRAGCLRTAKGGSSRQMLVRVGHHQIQMRTMTPREYERLQGVPDDYPISCNEIQAINGFGDGVCVPVVEWLARQVLHQAVSLLYP